jgi:hypothetical protein
MLNKNGVTKSYNKLIKKEQKEADILFNLQRERDFEVQKLNAYYQGLIDNAMRKQKATSLQVSLAKKYVAEINCDSSGLLSNQSVKKERN